MGVGCHHAVAAIFPIIVLSGPQENCVTSGKALNFSRFLFGKIRKMDLMISVVLPALMSRNYELVGEEVRSRKQNRGLSSEGISRAHQQGQDQRAMGTSRSEKPIDESVGEVSSCRSKTPRRLQHKASAARRGLTQSWRRSPAQGSARDGLGAELVATLSSRSYSNVILSVCSGKTGG